MNLDDLHSQLTEVMELCDVEYFLTEWDHDFCIDILIKIEEVGALTEKQLATAQRIITKYEIFEGEYYRKRYLPTKGE